MKRMLSVLALGVLLGAEMQAQKIVDTWGFTTGVDTTLWMDITGMDSTLIDGHNTTTGISNVCNIGFPFTLGATTHTQFSANTNGTIRLGSGIASPGSYNQPLGSNISNGPKIEPFGRRGRYDDSCYTRMALLGDSGSRVLVVEARVKEYSSNLYPGYYSYQVQLFETGALRIVYGESDSTGNPGTSQNGVSATRGNTTDKDVVFFDFATHTVSRLDVACTLTNAVASWPERGRWYMLTPDSAACPYPPSVTSTNQDPTGIWLQNSYGGLADLRVMIPSAGIDTIWPMEDSYFFLGGGFTPITTYYGTVQSVCDSGRTSYRTRQFQFTTGCGPVTRLPWSEDFGTTASATCWDVSQYTSTNKKWRRVGSAMRGGAASTGNPSNEHMVSPVFLLPDSDGIVLSWDYKSEEFVRAPQVEVRIVPCAIDGTVDSGVWTTLLTLNDYVANYTRQHVSLDPWRGGYVKVDFVNTSTWGQYAWVDNVTLRLQQRPLAHLQAPTIAHVGDSVDFVATMTEGVDSGVVYTWHSTLLNQTSTAVGGWSVVYSETGIDTITLVIANVYGADTVTAVVYVVDCNPVTALPWEDGFAHTDDCWVTSGWQKETTYAFHDEGNAYRQFQNVMYASSTGAYMLSQPISLPATGMHNMKLWVECASPLTVRLSPMAVPAIASFTDTLFTDLHSRNQSELWWQVADLEPYAGQTVRIGLFKEAGLQAFVNRVKIDYDTLPVLWQVVVPSLGSTDSTTVCSAALRRGSTDSLTVTWHSTLLDSTWVVNGDYTIGIHYPFGGIDTVTVVAANAYGADTVTRTVRVSDCNPATSLPWMEDFSDEALCWYKPLGSNWYTTTWSGNRYLYLNVLNDTLSNWIFSKEIVLPADTNLLPHLFWKPSWLLTLDIGVYDHLRYSVMITTDSDYTDTTNYTVLYTDSARRSRFGFDDLLSASLADYAGQHIHIAFRSYPHHLIRTVTVHDQYINIDDVLIRTTEVPVVSVAADANRYYYGDTATFTATLIEGSRAGISYTWHSTLLDSTLTTTTGSLRLTYGLLDGSDTVSVIATNAYGSDTAQVVVRSQMITTPSVTMLSAEDKFFVSGLEKAEVGDTVDYLISRNNCITTGMAYSLHSTLLDTTVTVSTEAETVRIPLVYTIEGIDTLTATIANIFDTTTSSTALRLMVSNCLGVSVPFFEDFEDIGVEGDQIPCWPGWWILSNLSDTNHAAHPGGTASLHPLLVSPLITLPTDTLGLQLSWYSHPANYSSASLPVKVLISPTGGKDYDDFTDTLFVGNVPNDDYHAVLLDDYLGEQIRFAFNYNWGYEFSIDNIRVDYDRSAPQLNIAMPDTAYTYDSLSVVATLAAGSPQGFAYSWHSSIGTVIGTGDRVTLFYTNVGTDTLTVVATNDYGSDTAMLTVEVVNHPLPQAAISGPGLVETGDTLTLTAVLNDCSQYGLGVSWHSSLTGNSAVGYLFQQVYGTGGIDTVTLMVSNHFGADTAIWVIRVLDCSGIALPYHEDFEEVTAVSSSTVGYLPGCWGYNWNGSNAAFAPHVITTGGYQFLSGIPNNALLLLTGGSTGYGNQAEVVLPRFADSLQHLSIAFDYWSESSGTLTVGYLYDNLFHAVATIPNHGGNYLRDTVNFASAISPDGRIALQWSHATSYWGVAIDNVEVFSDNTIYPPDSLTIDSIDVVSARVSWGAVTGATAYHVVVDSVVDTVVGSRSFGLIGLVPHTTYTVRVAAIVGTDTGRYATTTFTTLCGIQLPYYNDFSQGNNSIDCWTNYRTSSEIYQQQLSISKDAYSVCQMATPVIQAPGNSLFVTFQLKRRDSWREVSLIVGAMTDPTDASTFMPIDTFAVGSSWTECQFNTRGHGTTPLAIAFRPCNSYDDLLIDDLLIETSTPCARLLSVDATLLSATSAELSWEYDIESHLPILGALVTLYDTTSGYTTTFIAHGSDTILGGLPLRHTFRADISTYCGSDTSEPLSVTFTPSPMPCAEVQGDNDYLISHPIQNTNNYGYSQMLYPAVLAASVDTLYGIALRFTGVNDGDTRLIDVYIGQTSATTLTSPVSAANLTLAVQNHLFPALHGWVKIPFSTPVPLDGVRNLIVTIDDNTGHMGYNTMSFGAHLADTGGILYYDGWPNANVDPYTLGFALSSSSNIPDIQLLGHCATDRCLPPVVSVEPDTHSLTVAWTQRGSESLWRVEYREERDSTWIAVDSVANTTSTITGLNASSRYQVRVGSVCSDTNIIYSEVVTTATLCGTVDVPYYQNFLTNAAPCWNLRGYPPSANYGVDLLLSMPIVSPAINGNLSQMQVRFKITGSPNFHPVVKVGIGNSNGNNATWIDSIMLSSFDEEEHVVSLGSYTGSENHLLFIANTPYARIREVTIESVVCHAVHHITVSQLTDTSAHFNWPPAGNGNQWAVYIGDTPLAVTSTPTYTVRGLIPGNGYTFAVREICGAGDTSEATTVTFTTLCPPQPLPWSEDFESYTTSSSPMPCWSYIFRPLNVAVATTIAYIGYYNASHTLRIYDVTHSNPVDTNMTNFICTPMLMAGGAPSRIEFDAYLQNGHVTVGIMTDVADTNTFIPLTEIDDTSTHYVFTVDSSLFFIAFTCHGAVNCHIDNITVGECPTYRLTLAVNDTTMGSVDGDGTYPDGTQVTIAAIPNEGYHFVQWSDSVTDAARTIVLHNDISFTAFFAPDTVWHQVSVNTNVDGAVETYGSGRYGHGDTVEIGFYLPDTATEGGYWQFIGWNDTDATENPRMVVVVSDTLLTALFQWVADSVRIDEIDGFTQSVSIFPNPASHTVIIRSERDCTVAFLSADGREVLRMVCRAGDNPVDVQHLAQGVYFLRILDMNQPPIKLIVTRE